MTTDPMLAMSRSEFGTNAFGFFHFDREYARRWTVDTVAKRTIAIAALAILIAGSVPLLTTVHGQTARTPLQQEVEDLRAQVARLDDVPAQQAVIIAHQRLEDERYEKQEEFQTKVLWGFFGTFSGIMLAIFGWALSQFGITLGVKPVNSNRGHR